MAAELDLGPSLEAFVNQAVRAGRYPSREAVIREAVRLLREHEADWMEFEREMLSRIDAAMPFPQERSAERVNKRYAEMVSRRAL